MKNIIEICPGVIVKASWNEGHGWHELPVGACGYVGELRAGNRVRLNVECHSVPGVTLDKFTINETRDMLPLPASNEIVVLIMSNQKGRYPFASSKDNHIMFAHFTADGRITVHVIAVIGQGGKFYIVHQMTHSVQVYKGEQQIVCPDLVRRFGGWRQLNDRAREVFAGRRLPCISEYIPQKWDTSDLAENEVIVTVWSARKGSGGGVNRKGEGVGLYWEDLQSAPNIPAVLFIGEIVRCLRFDKPERQTSFKFEGRVICRQGRSADQVNDLDQDPIASNIAEQKKPSHMFAQ